MTSYALGVDLGTTYSAAVVGRGGTTSTLQLGSEAAAVPSVVVARPDGEVVLGDAAERRAAAEPTRTAREFKRRLGDSVPIVLGSDSYPIERLMAMQLADIVRRATEQEGEPPTKVVLTHPANYTEFKLGKLGEVATLAGLDADRVTLLPEPEAAAVAYSRTQRLEPGEVIAVYDFGGGTFDAALIRRTVDGFELLGVPEGMERLGGIDFDLAILAHVDQALEGRLSSADDTDPETLPSLAQLRVECRRAKEALSTDADTTIPVSMPGLRTQVSLTRAEFESMIRPRLAQTIEALRRTVASAGLDMSDVSRVLLVGGSSRIPLVGQMITAATGRPVSLDAHPKLTIATGAALVGAATVRTPAPATVRVGAAEWQTPTRATPPAAPPPSKKRPVALIAVGVAVLAAIAVAAVVVLTGSGDDAETAPSTTGTSQVTTRESDAPTTTATASSSSTAPPDETTPAETTPTETTPTDPPDTPDPGPTLALVTTLSEEPLTMSGPATGGMVVSTAAANVLSVAADGTTQPVATVPADIGEYGGITATPDGRYLASTPAGVIDLATGELVVDGSVTGLGATPGPIATDGLGNIYVADNDANRIIRQGTDGALSLVAGNGAEGSGGPADDGKPASTVGIGAVRSLTIDMAGRLVFFEDGATQARLVGSDGAIQQATSVPPLPSGVTTFAVDAHGGLWFASGHDVNLLTIS